ncbi:DUF2920 family protein [Campylobacter sp. IFREMER_LSEM_CL1904]|uniref:DUF2920 family protein n=1 Tax=unclassified Campylobacter TaxID=2593542 RepID=UPI0021E6ADD0|nr:MULTISPECIES: DUF2920 family protein [unclassified Campylobacter]MCV3428742.1 DUF2920 family protein [Campylobacter sp. IFREMER_LSEM_CL1904]MCV3480318.1 DUF2920 family protein [Campylobacter sp. CNRCH_2015_1657]HEC1756605.1 DUF2920 family protein [Campylobacter lari]
MLKNETYFIDSCDDVELNIKRESKLEYRITYDDSKQMKAIVFIIGAYGSNVDLSIIDFDRQFIAKKFDVVAVSVLYHCFSCRINEKDKRYSAQFYFDGNDVERIKKSLNKINLNSNDISIGLAKDYFSYLEHTIDVYKEKSFLNEDCKFYFTCTMLPANNEYQNYGIMAAIDHINVLKDIYYKFPNFKNLPKICGGVSYGGYLSLLISKIAPWYIDGVIDNSGEAMLILNYIIGKDFDTPDAICDSKNLKIGCFLRTYWNANKESPYCFKDENYEIRTLLNQTHLILQAQKNKNILYASYHNFNDKMASCEFKNNYMKILEALGYDVNFNLVDEKDIDGKFIKNSSHGSGINTKALFNKELPKMLEKFKDKNFTPREDSISYPCKDKVFTFKDKGNKFVLEII